MHTMCGMCGGIRKGEAMISKDIMDLGILAASIGKFVWGVALTIYVFFANRKKALDRIRRHWNSRIESA